MDTPKTGIQRPGRSTRRLIKITLLGIAAILLAVFVAIQFAPVQRTNPGVISEPKWDSPATRALAVRACFDCHSNETIWPWYAYVAPVSWLIARDVNAGRQRLNFSEWNAGRKRLANVMSRIIISGEMPPANYLIMHADAALSAEEKQALIGGLAKTLAQS